MKIDIIEPVGSAIQTTRRLLFVPFNFVKWCGMGFTAMLGADFLASTTAGFGPIGEPGDEQRAGLALFVDALRENPIPFALAGAAGLALWVAALWVIARGRFMFLDNVARNAGEIREPWRRLRPLGNSLFRFTLALAAALVVCLLALVLVATLVAMPDIRRQAFDLNAIGAIALGGLGLFLIIMAWGVISVMTDDFVAPIMYASNKGALKAWQEFIDLLRPNTGVFTLYILFRLLLEIGLRAIAALICVLTCCAALLPFAGTLFRLPLLVFRRAYSLRVLEQFGDRYRLLPALQPAPPEIPGRASNAPGPT